MARSQETWNKKEIAKKKEKKRKDKETKKLEKKDNPKESSSLDNMLAYVDEYGNITSTPPDPSKRRVIKKEDIEIGVPKREIEIEELVRNGVVTHFNDSKGYGFIKDLKTQESVFVHVNGLIDEVKENDKVTFEVKLEKKGLTAVAVKKAV
ncbi:MAG: cold shock domain-containing protein [Bacteroidetes bacterium]|nr:cold shock domain-containing protein [Bacteroidota bacterium]HET6246022.1 cold shock domain-containing protein [Bacteroidia bacterium]